MNRRQAFLNLPLEIIHLVLTHLVVWPTALDFKLPSQSLALDPPRLQPPWRSTATYGSALIPISQTCRFLRQAALSYPSLWSTIVAVPGLYRLYWIPKNKLIPLAVVVAPSKNFARILDFYPAVAGRVQELHIVDVGHRHHHFLQGLLVPYDHHNLQRYFISGKQGLPFKWTDYTLPLPPSSTNTLRTLSIANVPLLPQSNLANLTHLFLRDILLPQLRQKLITALKLCPALEALVLQRLRDRDEQYSSSKESLSELALGRLRRVTFDERLEHGDRTSHHYFLAPLLSTVTHGIAVQILDKVRLLPRNITSPILGALSQDPSVLVFSLHSPEPLARSHACFIALTAIQPLHVYHHVMYGENMLNTGPGRWQLEHWAERVLGDPTVREVWMCDNTALIPNAPSAFTNPSLPMLPPSRLAEHERLLRPNHDGRGEVFQRISTGLPALETLVLAFDCTELAPNAATPEPILAVSADPREHASFRRLRVVYGYRHGRCGDARRTLRFTHTLQAAGGGRFKLVELVVQLHRLIDVDDGDVDALRACFASVRVEYVGRAGPALAPSLPAFCVEPEAGPAREFEYGALW